MRVKELNNKIAYIAWSPAQIHPCYMAAGTASQQLDNSNSSSSLDLIKLDLSNASADLEVTASYKSESRFNKLIWNNDITNNKNIIVGGCENNNIYLYDYEKILKHDNDSSPMIKSLQKHTGPVAALDINPYQSNLLASGSSSSEIFIWDLNNPTIPMTPGAKIQPLDDINCVAWNNQVQHILASTCSGKCIVWDLRKNESIIKVTDHMSKMRAKHVAWHPEIATQMCLSSEDDNTPFLQIWDLRFATSPVRVLEGHNRGILSFCWCPIDSNLLVSSAKDNRTLCWNPNNSTTNGEIVYEMSTNGQWCFDLAWCKRNPNLIATSSFEGQINVCGLMGGVQNVLPQTSSKIMDSFGGSASVVNDTSADQLLNNVVAQQETIAPLKIAPKWMKPLCGASFGFGGKLVTFGKSDPSQSTPPSPNLLQQQSERLRSNSAFSEQQVHINQVTTDAVLVENSHYLENTLQTGNFVEYCNYKIEQSTSMNNETQTEIWKFIHASFSANNTDKNNRFIQLLGFTFDNVKDKINSFIKNTKTNGIINTNAIEDNFDSLNLKDHSTVQTNGHQSHQGDDAFSQLGRSLSPVNFRFDNQIENTICEGLLLGQYESVIDLCIKENRFIDALLIANTFDANLINKIQTSYFNRHDKTNKKKSEYSKFLNSLLTHDWSRIVQQCEIDHWREALVMLLTYCTNENELTSLCDILANRLHNKSDENKSLGLNSEEYLLNACICYICSANLDSLVGCWQKLIDQTISSTDETKSPSSNLQDLIEKVMVLRYSFPRQQNNERSFQKLNAKLIQYAKLLADQGCFLNAYNYIKDSNDESIQIIKDRVFNNIDPRIAQQFHLTKPNSPFKALQQTNNNQSIKSRNNSIIYNNVNRSTPQQQQLYNLNGINNQQQQQQRTQTPIYQPSIDRSFQQQQQQPIINNFPPSQMQQNYQPLQQQNQSPATSIYTPQAQQPIQQNSSNSLFSSLLLFFFIIIFKFNINKVPETPVTSYMYSKPATAWNDPPMVQPKQKVKIEICFHLF
jgi:protein transport protein SEC31